MQIDLFVCFYWDCCYQSAVEKYRSQKISKKVMSLIGEVYHLKRPVSIVCIFNSLQIKVQEQNKLK